MKPTLTVKANNYVSNYYFLENDIIRFDRVHRVTHEMKLVEALPRVWTLAFGSIEPNQIFVPIEGGEYELNGPCAVFTPPCCPVQWHLLPGVMEFTVFIGSQKIPNFELNQPMVFNWTGKSLPSHLDQIVELLSSEPAIYVKNRFRQSKAAERTKNLIDQNYFQRRSIAELAKGLGYSHSFLTRSFKSSFGLSPVEYRSKLRLFDAQLLLLQKQQKVSTVAFASGFSDTSHFLKQFRQLFQVRPSQFRYEVS